MVPTVCLGANTLHYIHGGGHLWVYLNWALGLRAAGCDVIWLEAPWPGASAQTVLAQAATVEEGLEPYGLGGSMALSSQTRDELPPELTDGFLDLDAAAEADLLLNFRYETPQAVVNRFPRSAVVDIDPGLLQTWLRHGEFELAAHDVYFTIGENDLPDAGLEWQHTPPCVSLDWWSPQPRANGTAAFTTVTHWHGPQWVGDLENGYCNEKRLGFLPFLDLAERVTQPLELALPGEEEEAAAELRRRGWRVRHSQEVAGTPWDYQRYVQSSLGEFSCAKPSAVLLQNAWLSDRTLCYLASGKPSVIQHTGPSDFLPDAEGLFRFRTLEDAAAAFDVLAADYDRHRVLARQLAEEHFDARKVVTRVLERALA